MAGVEVAGSGEGTCLPGKKNQFNVLERLILGGFLQEKHPATIPQMSPSSAKDCPSPN